MAAVRPSMLRLGDYTYRGTSNKALGTCPKRWPDGASAGSPRAQMPRPASGVGAQVFDRLTLDAVAHDHPMPVTAALPPRRNACTARTASIAQHSPD